MPDDYKGAAVRHCADCKALRKADRNQSAAYLGGYAIECVLKAFLSSANIKDDGKHQLGNIRNLIASVTFNPALAIFAAQLPRQFRQGTSLWSHHLRYRTDDPAFQSARIDELIADAETSVGIMNKAWTDGLL